MENNVPDQWGPGVRPDWFLSWLRDVFLPESRDPIASQVEQFENAVERIPNLDESVKKSLTTTLSTEARINWQKQDDKSKVQQLLKTQTLVIDEAVSPMPWSKLTESEAKIISRVVENIKQQDFSTKSLKHWTVHFSDVFDNFSFQVWWAVLLLFTIAVQPA